MNDTSKSTETPSVPELVIKVKGETRKIALDTTPGKSIIIGRDTECEISLPEAIGVSRQHCKITAVVNAFMLLDLGSTNGTYADDEEVKQATPIKAGITYTIGDVTFQVTGVQQKATEAKDGVGKKRSRKKGVNSTTFARIRDILNPLTNEETAQKVGISELIFTLILTLYIGMALYNYTHGGSILPPFLD